MPIPIFVYYVATLNHCIIRLMSKYALDNSLNVSYTGTVLKEQMWKHFVDTAVFNGKFKCIIFHCLVYLDNGVYFSKMSHSLNRHTL